MNGPEHYPFSVRPLPYPSGALAPMLDGRTVRIHHDGHYASYVQKLNEILKSYPQYQKLPLEALILKQAFLPEKIRTDVKRNAGGAFNHKLYFESLAPAGRSTPSPSFEKIICECFGTVNNLLVNLKEAGMSVFGSGYAYLTSDMCGKLHILTMKNQDTPIEQRLNPLFPLDVWEHAYYLQYQNRRDRYLNAILKLINWKVIEQNYHSFP